MDVSRIVVSALVMLMTWPYPVAADSKADLHAACEKGDVERVRLLLNDADANAANEHGETPLMLAAKTGNFELCRALLWAGARATTSDNSGKKVRDHLKMESAGISPVNLLLRCYAYVQTHGIPARTRPSRPELVIISDNFIDHDNRDLKARYWVNQAELKGKAGVDDDQNGFVDDVHGWNASADEPLRVPLLANVADKAQEDLLRRFVTLLNRDDDPGYGGDEWKDQTLEDLEGAYENPLVRQLGFDVLEESGVDLDDRVFTRMLAAASHGTHVAGIVLKSSGGKALLHGMMHGRFQMPKEARSELVNLARRLAPRTISYEQFLLKMRQSLLDNALKEGRRRSAYLRTTGAGVVNMSWGQTKTFFLRTAMQLQNIYREHGLDPDSIDSYTCPAGLDLCGDLGFELLVNAAAELALLFHENPDVIFVVSAGNDAEDNDEELPSPAYLSRFFPNVITVASVDEDNELSSFSNYGSASVQVAAPGEKILSTLIASQQGFMSGTSMASPAVAGVAARIRAAHPRLTAADVRLILERSVNKLGNLESEVASGGVMDAEAALALAADWTAGSRADLTLAALARPRKPVDEGILASEKDEGTNGHRSGEVSATAEDKGARVTAIGGFADQWRVVMKHGIGFLRQVVHPVGELPIGWIRDKWNDGWEITSIGGENEHWRVVMSHTGKPGREQKLVGLDFDTGSLDDLQSIGWRITSHAGFVNSWVFVLTRDTGWKEQLYPLPGSFDDSRRKWLHEHLAQGWRITSLAGDDNEKDRSQDSWSVVITRGTNLGEQVFTGPAAWPEAWISANAKNGFQISNCSGFDDHWVVVMTKGSPSLPQTISEGGAWDDAWVQRLWKAEE
ncbi:MAG TPA: S8 family serine peptidase [Prosthecobacter sp.]|nr:S8 family serine peptidase [Prosthecobacter sp.]